jgi:hypothetical protein
MKKWNKRVKKIFSPFLVSLSLMGFISSMLYGDTGNIKIQPYVTVQEEYNDNINLTSKNKKTDFITTLIPGIAFSKTKGPYGYDFDYRFGVVMYNTTTDNNYLSHTGKLNTWVKLGPRWTLRLKENFIRTEESGEGDNSLAQAANRPDYSINRQRAVYIRNVLEPSVEYQFGKENRFAMTYRNNLYRTQNPLSQDSQEDMVNASYTHWVNVKHGIILDYSYSRGEFKNNPTLRTQAAKGRYTYRLTSKTSFYGEHAFLRNDFDSPGIDYMIHNPSFGIDHAFSSSLSGSAQIGYFWKNSSNGTTNGYTYLAGLTQKESKTVYSFFFQGGYSEDYFTAENLGFVRYNRAIAKITHRPRERMTLEFSGSLERAEFEPNRTDWIWGLVGSASYQPLQWLTLSLEASRREDNSNVESFSFGENKVLFKLTATY